MVQEKSKVKSFPVNRVKSQVLKMGAKTIFFDVNLAENNKKYLKITESRFTGEGSERTRSSVVLFPENIAGFQKSLSEMAGYLA